MSMSQQNARALEDILIAAKKHPQSNVAKLIYTVREEPTQRNICLLLVELSKNKDFYTDFSVQLGYYLNLFQQQPSGADVLNQAGLLLLASADIYARRVDYIQELVHLLNTSLSQTDKEIEETKRNAENDANAIKTPELPKRVNRKRLVDALSDPFEIELVPKKLKTITKEKRNAVTKPEAKAKFNYRSNYSEDHIHPALYLLSSIVDLDNEADVESKKNFQSFTYRLEHRYSTLVPDVNFRLHFVVKDYLDEEGERMREQTGQDSVEAAREWPPLSEEYLQNLITLENQILSGKEPADGYADSDAHDTSNCHLDDDGLDFSRQVLQSNSTLQNQSLKMQRQMFDDLRENAELNSSMLNASREIELSTSANISQSALKDTTLGQSGFDSACIIANSTITNENAFTQSTQNSANSEQSDSGIGDSFGSQSSTSSGVLIESTLNSTASSEESTCQNATNSIDSGTVSSENSQANATTTLISDTTAVDTRITLDGIRVKLPHHAQDDSGVLFSQLDVQEQRMLSPSVLAIDILPQVPNKDKITIVLDEELKELLNVHDDENAPNGANTFELPSALALPIQPLKLNILKIHEKHFKRRTLFKLCAEFELFMKARYMKRKRYDESTPDPVRILARQLKMFKEFQERQQLTDFKLSPSTSDKDFCGFDDSHLENERSESDQLDTMSLIFDEDFHGFQDSEIDYFAAEENQPTATISNDDAAAPAPIINPECTVAATATAESAVIAESLPAACTPTNETVFAEGTSGATEDVAVNSEEVDFGMENNKKSSIQLWHEALRPVLAGSSERHHFNIFDLGTNILDIVQTNNNTATLSDVMADKDMSFCPRYFLSMLILATHNNIELNVMDKSDEQPCEWSDVKFSLLSTRRHALAPEDDICIVSSANSTSGKSSTNSLKTQMKPLKKSVVTAALPVASPTSATPSLVLLTPPETPPVTPPTLPRLTALPMTTQFSTASTTVQAFNKPPADTTQSLTGRCTFVGKNPRKRLASSDEFNVNLNTFRIVQPIEQIPIQNDEQDSGFCSNDCRSSL